MNSCAVRIFEPHTLGGAAEMAGVEVVDLTLSDDEEDVAVGNRDEEVVEVVVNREVRGAGPANRADDDEDEVVVTGAILGTPFPFLRRDASTSDARVRVKGAPLRYESVLGPFRSGEPGTTRDDFLAHAPLKPSDLTHLVNLFFTPPAYRNGRRRRLGRLPPPTSRLRRVQVRLYATHAALPELLVRPLPAMLPSRTSQIRTPPLSPRGCQLCF